MVVVVVLEMEKGIGGEEAGQDEHDMEQSNVVK